MNKYKPVVLIVMDGFGLSSEKKGNAIAAAKTPNLNDISLHYPGTALQAAGVTVGIPWGEVGNSEVGHTAIGSGLLMYQHLSRINFTIKDGSFAKIPVWQTAIDHAVKNKSAIHLAGLLSAGGIHSHKDHLLAILRLLAERNFSGKVFVHVFTDGRDAPANSGEFFVRELEDHLKDLKIGKIATVIGRYYAMDRDKRLERTKAALDAMVNGQGETATSALDAVKNSYQHGVKDEFIKPTVIDSEGNVKSNDVLIFFNFRPDRARQLAESFTKAKIENLLLITMTQYDEDYPALIVFPPENVPNPLAKIISFVGKKQLHIAETEKYAHITYFLNGGQEKPFPGEERLLVPSPKVDNYDQEPAMSVYEITDKLIAAIGDGQYDFIATNFANGDMVGHTGNLEAAIKAVEAMDECIGKIKNAVLAAGGALVITADHGNCEEMINLETGEPDTEHSVNPVPFWFVAPDNRGAEIKTPKIIVGGILPDVAPTILEVMGLPKPPEMIGNSLLRVITRQPI